MGTNANSPFADHFAIEASLAGRLGAAPQRACFEAASRRLSTRGGGCWNREAARRREPSPPLALRRPEGASKGAPARLPAPQRACFEAASRRLSTRGGVLERRGGQAENRPHPLALRRPEGASKGAPASLPAPQRACFEAAPRRLSTRGGVLERRGGQDENRPTPRPEAPRRGLEGRSRPLARASASVLRGRSAAPQHEGWGCGTERRPRREPVPTPRPEAPRRGLEGRSRPPARASTSVLRGRFAAPQHEGWGVGMERRPGREPSPPPSP